VEDKTFNWQRGDVIAVPSWKLFNHRASTNATLLEITDQPVIEALGWYRETTV
jgi:gentisate 1,2-dioxygenase